MKTKIIRIILLLILPTMVACEKYLDIKPMGQTIPQTEAEFAALLHSHLHEMETGGDRILVGNAEYIRNFDAVCTDNFEPALSTDGAKAMPVYAGTAAYQYSAAYYDHLYNVIRDCNIIIGQLPVKDTDDNTSLRAAAHAMRGICYYQLLRLFAPYPDPKSMTIQLGVPLVKTFDLEERPTRATIDQTVNQIEQDFNQALTLGMTDKSYLMTPQVVNAYKARLFFWTSRWEKAIQTSSSIIKGYVPMDTAAYHKMMAGDAKAATNALLKVSGQVREEHATAYNNAMANMRTRPISTRLINAFAPEDRAKDIRYQIMMDAKRFVTKKPFNGIRPAELLLMQAECHYHLGQQAEALRLINMLRKARIPGTDDLKASQLPALRKDEIIRTDATGKPLTPLLALIQSERRKELFMEGDRFFEIKRNGAPEYAMIANGLKYTVRNYMYTFPIPARDCVLITGMQQNPGYGAIIDK